MTEIPSQLPSDDGLIKARPNGDAGDAIDWALDHIDEPFARLDFLECWRSDDLEDWPEYLRWVKFQQTCAAESRNDREALSRHKAPLSDEMEICDVCGGAGGDNQHSICGKCYGAGGYRKAPLSVAGDDVERLREALDNIASVRPLGEQMTLEHAEKMEGLALDALYPEDIDEDARSQSNKVSKPL